MKFKERHRAEPDPEPVERDDVHVAANRCPFCHEGVEAKASVACQECLARHHEACWQEGGACSACGSTEALESTSRAEVAPAGVETLPSGTLSVVFMGFGALVLCPLVVWLQFAHGIDQIGPLPAIVLPLVPFVIGGCLSLAVNWKRLTPKRRMLGSGLALVAISMLVLVMIAPFLLRALLPGWF